MDQEDIVDYWEQDKKMNDQSRWHLWVCFEGEHDTQEASASEDGLGLASARQLPAGLPKSQFSLKWGR